MENLVAQMLVASGHWLYFFSHSRGQTRAEEMEIDFQIAKSKFGQRQNITPIEVISGKAYFEQIIGQALLEIQGICQYAHHPA